MSYEERRGGGDRGGEQYGGVGGNYNEDRGFGRGRGRRELIKSFIIRGLGCVVVPAVRLYTIPSLRAIAIITSAFAIVSSWRFWTIVFISFALRSRPDSPSLMLLLFILS